MQNLDKQDLFTKHDSENKISYRRAPVSFIKQNKLVSNSIVFCFIMLIAVLIMEKKSSFVQITSRMRGEVALNENFLITKIHNKYPLIIRSEDPFVSNSLRMTGNVKSLFTQVAESLCQPGDTVVEIGAHFGFNTILLAHKLQNRGHYYAYEANHTICNCLKKSITLNDLERIVTLKNVAITGRAGACNVEDYLALTLAKKKTSRTIHCNSSTISMEFSDQPISKLLLDMPEYGMHIIKGAYNAIDRSPDITIILHFDYESASKHCSVENEFATLAHKGMNFYVANKDGSYEPLDCSQIQLLSNQVLVISKNQISATGEIE